jgi:hypothetical protein
MEHSFNEANQATRADVWERVSREFPITNLRWTIDDVNTIESGTLNRMKMSTKTWGDGYSAHRSDRPRALEVRPG